MIFVLYFFRASAVGKGQIISEQNSGVLNFPNEKQSMFRGCPTLAT